MSYCSYLERVVTVILMANPWKKWPLTGLFLFLHCFLVQPHFLYFLLVGNSSSIVLAIIVLLLRYYNIGIYAPYFFNLSIFSWWNLHNQWKVFILSKSNMKPRLVSWHVPSFFLFCFLFQIHGIGTSIYPSIIFMIYEEKIKTFVMFITIVCCPWHKKLNN